MIIVVVHSFEVTIYVGVMVVLAIAFVRVRYWVCAVDIVDVVAVTGVVIDVVVLVCWVCRCCCFLFCLSLS